MEISIYIFINTKIYEFTNIKIEHKDQRLYKIQTKQPRFCPKSSRYIVGGVLGGSKLFDEFGNKQAIFVNVNTSPSDDDICIFHLGDCILNDHEHDACKHLASQWRY